MPVSTANPFNLTLEHVHGADGKPLHVENMRQLAQAEKTYNFESCVLNRDAQNFDDAPQQQRIDMARIHKFKFSSERQYRERYG